MCAGVYYKNLGLREGEKQVERIGNLIYSTSPLILFFIIFLLGDLIALLPLVIGYIVFILRGQEYSNLSLKELYSRYQKRIINRLSGPIQASIIAILVIPPLIFFIGLQIGGISFFEGIYGLVNYLIDPNLMILINLPIILTARLIYLYSFYLTYLKYNKRDSEKPIMELFSKNQRMLFITSNVLIVLFSILLIYVAIFFAIYSLLMATLRFNVLNTRYKQEKYTSYAILLYFFIPMFFIYAIMFYSGSIGFIPISIAAVCAFPLFIIKGQEYGHFSLKEFSRRYFRTAKRRAPNFIKYFVLGYIIIVPIIILFGLTIGSDNYRKHTVMIRMSDGTFLATDIIYSPLAWDYIKNEPLPAPVIFVRTPYGKGGLSLLYDSLYCSQGFHVVIQDFRGCYDSEGGTDFFLFTKDYTDGPETIEWIRKQPWSNGKIGSSGISALCISAYLYAGMNPEGLLTQSLWFGTPDLVRDAILEGAFHEALVFSWIKGVAPNNWRNQIDYIFGYINDPSRINEIEPRSVMLEEAPNSYENVNVSALHVGGWYDHFLRGTIRGYMGYDKRGMIGARGRQKMIIGPWIHGNVFTGSQGELKYPENANGLPLMLKWEEEIFNEAFFGIEKDIWSGDRVAYYLMGDIDDPKADANYWKFAPDWPINNSYEIWYFGKNGQGNYVVVKDGTGLQSNLNISYLYDPRHPIETRGGNNEPGYTKKGAGPFDQRPVEEVDGVLRDDLILFLSDEITTPLTFEGDLAVRLFISSNATDTDFMVKLSDVYPDGRRMLIIDSAKTTRFWKNQTEINLIIPYQIYEFTIEMPATAYQFNTGHRIAITIQSSNYDRYALNPNTGGPITDHYSEGFIANNTIITGPGKSCIYFPLRI